MVSVSALHLLYVFVALFTHRCSSSPVSRFHICILSWLDTYLYTQLTWHICILNWLDTYLRVCLDHLVNVSIEFLYSWQVWQLTCVKLSWQRLTVGLCQVVIKQSDSWRLSSCHDNVWQLADACYVMYLVHSWQIIGRVMFPGHSCVLVTDNILSRFRVTPVFWWQIDRKSVV